MALKFQAWVPGSDLTNHLHSLGELEFYSPEAGLLAVQSIAGLIETGQGGSHRRLNPLMELTPFGGFVDEAEFKSLIEKQPIPARLKEELSVPGLVHVIKRLPSHHFLFDASSPAALLREFLTVEALGRLHADLEQMERTFQRLRLTMESPVLMVDEQGAALLLNFETIRERRYHERRFHLTREKDLVEEARGLP